MSSRLESSTLSPTQANMLLSSRQPPTMTLRRVASYNSLVDNKGPMSSTSSRFSFNHLLQSPPPSPRLPALVPRHSKPSSSATSRRRIRFVFWLSGVLCLLYFGFSILKRNRPVRKVGWSTNDDQEYEMVGDDALPDFPTPVVGTDKRGRAKWTISIPTNYDFPLEQETYFEICRQTKEASDHVGDLHNHKHIPAQAHHNYNYVDPYFMDVAEAEEVGMLPGPGAGSKMWGLSGPGRDGNIIGESKQDLVDMEICKTSMTFVMQTNNAGLGHTLMMLWSAYGLAQKEGRAFFVDDSRWAYGSYTSFFQPPPLPDCRPPPRHEMLPCPHHARHLVVSAANNYWTFGGAFTDEYENPKGHDIFRQDKIFGFARAGYEALFHLAEEDAQYVLARILELRSKTVIADSDVSGIVLGVHVRRGDRHPFEPQYRDSYIPLDRYSDLARDILHTRFNDTATGVEDMMAEMHSVMVVASDDPDVYDSNEFSHAPRAQEQIVLASKKSIPDNTAAPTGTMFKRFVEQTVGWEGGFFSGMFWSLGKSDSSMIGAGDTGIAPSKVVPSAEAARLRELVGRAYLMDLAVLEGASDTVICAVSAMGCKLLAVMMGWEKAVEQEQWVNLENMFGWRGVMWSS